MKGVIVHILCLILATNGASVFAQTDTLVINGSTDEKNRVVLQPYLAVYEFGHKTKSFQFIRTEAKFIPFKTYDQSKKHTQPVWVRLTIKDVSNGILHSAYILYLGNRIVEDTYEERNGKITHNNLNLSKSASEIRPNTTIDGLGIPLSILPGETVTFWIKSTDMILATNLDPVLFSLTGYGDFKKEHTYSKLFHYTYICLVMGLCLFLGLMAFTQSIYNKDPTYFFWALYLWSNFIVFFTALDYTFEMALISTARHPWTIVSQYVVQIFYLLFLNSFLEIRKHNPKIFRLLLLLELVIFSATFFAVFAVSQANADLRQYADAFTFLTAILILMLFVRIVKSGIPQTNLLVIGSFGALLAGFEAVIFDQFELSHYGIFWLDPFIFFSLGVIFELIFFSLALSQRTRLIQLENQLLQKNYTMQLEMDLAVRVDTIQTQNSLLEEQRIARLTNEFEQKIAETEISALRSQMNPHFIFNCLNSIKLYTLENKSEAASDYLTKFSRLIRLVLENSRSEKVTLENELETLSLYAEMEVMRFKNKVRFHLKIADQIDPIFIEIPPLLLQPFVENAIWHGLMHKEEGGNVTVDVSMATETLLRVEVIDDGVGRQKSKEYKSKSATVHKSFGMKVTNERIEMINHIYKINTNIRIVDLQDQNQMPTGTKIIIEIPV